MELSGSTYSTQNSSSNDSSMESLQASYTVCITQTTLIHKCRWCRRYASSLLSYHYWGKPTCQKKSLKNKAHLHNRYKKKLFVSDCTVCTVCTACTDKILESLAARTNTASTLLASTLKTTAQYGSCNQAIHSQSQINHLIRQIANPLNRHGS